MVSPVLPSAISFRNQTTPKVGVRTTVPPCPHNSHPPHTSGSSHTALAFLFLSLRGFSQSSHTFLKVPPHTSQPQTPKLPHPLPNFLVLVSTYSHSPCPLANSTPSSLPIRPHTSASLSGPSQRCAPPILNSLGTGQWLPSSCKPSTHSCVPLTFTVPSKPTSSLSSKELLSPPTFAQAPRQTSIASFIDPKGPNP